MCVLSPAFPSPRKKEEGLQIYWILNISGPHYRSGSYGKNVITARLMLDKQVFEGDPPRESSPTNAPCFHVSSRGFLYAFSIKVKNCVCLDFFNRKTTFACNFYGML